MYRLELLWLRLQVLPRPVLAILLSVVLLAGGAGGYVLVTSGGASDSSVAAGTTTNGNTNSSQSGSSTTKPTTSKPGSNTANPGTDADPAAEQKALNTLLKVVDSEVDAARATRIAITSVRGNTAMNAACASNLQSIGRAMWSKFGVKAIAGDNGYCGSALVHGIAESEFKKNGIGKLSAYRDACTTATTSPALCIGGLAFAYAVETSVPKALSFCSGTLEKFQYDCSSYATRLLGESTKTEFPISVCKELKSATRLGCLSTFGQRVLGVGTTLSECSKLSAEDNLACVATFSLMLVNPPTAAGTPSLTTLFNQCAISTGCPENFGRRLRYEGSGDEQVAAKCNKVFEAATAKKSCIAAKI